MFDEYFDKYAPINEEKPSPERIEADKASVLSLIAKEKTMTENNKKLRFRPLIAAAAAAAVFGVTTVSVGAATGWDFASFFSNTFETTRADSAENTAPVFNGLPARPLDLEQTVEGVTVRLTGMINDDKNICISYELESDDPYIQNNPNIYPEILPDDDEYLDGCMLYTSYDKEESGKGFVFFSTRNSIVGRTLNLKMFGLTDSNGSDNWKDHEMYKRFEEGVHFSVDVEQGNVPVKEIPVNYTFETGINKGITVTTMKLNPFSIDLYYVCDGTAVSDGDHSKYLKLFGGGISEFHMKDGTVMSTIGGSVDETNFTNNFIYPINPDDFDYCEFHTNPGNASPSTDLLGEDESFTITAE